ncbi:MAG TPA: hypothetical protein VFX35_01420 [Solirubrobacterales bacterium]|nr:hypothetical protein [Solirubrobacterales bacterium]
MSGENGNGTEAAAKEAETPTREIVRKQPKPLSLRDPAQLARAAAASGYWEHITNPSQAVMIMAHGEELGLSPMAALQGLTMIEETLGYKGHLIGQLLRRHESYDYKVIERSNKSCTLQFLIDDEPIDDGEEGKVTFSLEDAERMELVKPRSNWVKTPRAMCFWRCLTEGARVYFPDLTMGTPVYSTEEIEEVITEPLIVDAEVVQDGQGEAGGRLPEDRVAGLVGLWKKVEPIFEADERNVNALDGLNVMLGSLGIDGFKGVTSGIEGLSSEQADQVEEALQAILDEEADTADREEATA